MSNFNTSHNLKILPPSKIKSWLYANGSMTSMLEAKARQPLRVQRDFEGYRLLSLAQKRQLGFQGPVLNRPILAWICEVQLYGNNELPWVWAQSIFPLNSLQGRARRLQYLKGTPIGYVLFKRSRTLPCLINVSYRILTKAGNGKRDMTGMDESCLLVKPFYLNFLSDLFIIENTV